MNQKSIKNDETILQLPLEKKNRKFQIRRKLGEKWNGLYFLQRAWWVLPSYAECLEMKHEGNADIKIVMTSEQCQKSKWIMNEQWKPRVFWFRIQKPLKM